MTMIIYTCVEHTYVICVCGYIYNYIYIHTYTHYVYDNNFVGGISYYGSLESLSNPKLWGISMNV